MKRWIVVMAAAALLVATAYAADDREKVLERINSAGTVLNEIQAAPDKGIPEEIMASADCVAVIPSMLKGGFVFGASYGKGVATCRHAGTWSAPAPIRIEGGSWGLQIGGQAVDLVMLVMNQKGMDQLLQSKFKVGADVSAAAGPVGRHVEGTTDWKMRAQVLTYSRARGAFAGITLNGAVLKQDDDDTRLLYGRPIPFGTILSGSIPAPSGSQAFLADVSKYFRVSKGAETASSGAPAGTAGGTTGTATTGSMATSEQNATGAVSSGTQPGKAGQTGTASEQQSATGLVDQPAATAAPSSADVQRNIQKALRDTPGLSAADVVVNVTGESVELNGSVPTENDKDNTFRIAQQNAGARKVVNNLVVK